MCGIAGIIDYGARSQVENVRRMNQTLAHRGPDDGGLWHSGIATIGHRRLKILDLTDQAAQPMRAKQSGLVLSYNGEIYNYIELREELRTLGWTFRTRTDKEVLFAACMPRRGASPAGHACLVACWPRLDLQESLIDQSIQGGAQRCGQLRFWSDIQLPHQHGPARSQQGVQFFLAEADVIAKGEGHQACQREMMQHIVAIPTPC